MSSPFVAEIRIFGFNFPPTGWAYCNGQLMPISQNTALFSLLGTNYGGDGKSTFGLPNFLDSAPMHEGFGPGPGLSDHFVGEQGGVQSVTLQVSEIPAHSHGVQGEVATPDSASPGGNLWASGQRGFGNVYAALPSNVQMSPLATSTVGGSVPHNNMQPYLTLNFCIALQGVFPPRG